jgi:uncharacterized Zn-finger protein
MSEKDIFKVKFKKKILECASPLLQCEVCRRSFAVKSTLNAHMRTHTQERTYTCNVCEKHYSSASSLGVHMR